MCPLKINHSFISLEHANSNTVSGSYTSPNLIGCQKVLMSGFEKMQHMVEGMKICR